MNNFTKCISLIKSISNPFLFIYKVAHSIEMLVPSYMAAYIYNKNRRDIFYANKELGLITYDGSGQLVHPDCILYNDIYFFVATPYPYGMEEYENPCIYSGSNIKQLKLVFDKPLDNQGRIQKGNHLSDPCLLSVDNDLYCAYRRTIKKDKYIENSIIIKQILHGTNQCKKKVIIKSNEGLLSPAFLYTKNQLHMLYINWNNDSSEIHDLLLNHEFDIVAKKTILCEGMPRNYSIWHIGIFQDKNITKGLFSLRNFNNRENMMLCYAEFEESQNIWKIKYKVKIPQQLEGKIIFTYKSCFVPNSDNIILSVRDIKNRHYLYITKLMEEDNIE